MLSNLKSIEENREYLKSVIGTHRRNEINWTNSIGCEIVCEYNWYGECSKRVLKIVKYVAKKQTVYFEGYEKGIETSNLIRCRLGGMLDFKSLEFKYEIGDTVNCLTIIDREHRHDKKDRDSKYYKYKCNKCGNIDWIIEGGLKKGQRCNACCLTPKKVVFGINSIYDKALWMIDLGMSIEDAKTHTPNSNEKVYVECPLCGKGKKIAPNTIYRTHSISCSCGDGISYPEKLMESILIQLNVKYERQYGTDWSKKKMYDFYLPDYNIIIETHGEQHYEECKSFTKKNLKDVQENDKFKEELALNNGIKNYIVINCSASDLEYIKNNILDSELNKLFDLSNINWNKCEEYALKNKVKEVCNYYKEHSGITPSNLAKEFSMCKQTIREYLKRGTELGWCEYDGKEELRRNGKLNGKRRCKPVSQFSIEGEFIKTYPSANEATNQTGINTSNISACCNGRYKTAGGYVWRYLD